jgi:predicted permease
MHFRRLRSALARLAGLPHRDESERELAEELETHLQMQIEENLRAGMSPHEARRRALVKLGGMTQAKEECRRQRGFPMLEDLWRDLRYGLRILLKKPGFTSIAVLTLALGIGANAAIFSLVNALLLRPVEGVEAPERLVSIYTSDYSSGLYGGSSYPDYLDFRDQADAFTGLAAFEDTVANLTFGGEAERLRGQAVTGNYFSVLGVRPAAGRTLLPADDAGGAPQVVVISHGLWRRRFNSDRGLVGTGLMLDGRTYTLVGVAAENFKGTRLGPTSPDFWVQLARPDTASPDARGNRGIDIVGRLRDGVTLEQAQEQVSAVAARLAREYPDTNMGTLGRPDEPRPVTVTPETRLGPQRQKAVWAVSAVLLAVVTCVLLIACANVANLMLVRASTRGREMAVRLALGAGRLRLVRQLLTESLCLALAGGAAGLLIARWTADLLPTFFPRDDAAALDFSLDWRVIAFTASVSLLSGAFFGLTPALRATRPDLVPALKDAGGAPVGGRRRLSLTNALVVAQVALSLVLLVGAGLFIRSLLKAVSADLGFTTENVLVARLDLRGEEAEAGKGQLFYRELQERVGALPGVRSVGLARIVPLSGGGMRRGTIIEGYEPRPGEDVEINMNVVSPGYFGTVGIPLAAGRDFGAQDVKGGPGVVIVNEEFARRYFSDGSPLGKRLRIDSEGPFLEVVGVARDSKYRNLREDPLPFFYVPLAQNYAPGMALLVRTEVAPAAVAPLIRAEVQGLNKSVPVFGVGTLEGHLAAALATERMLALLLSLFGGAALLLAAVGIYGVISYAVVRRTREIGVRMALGARARDILRMVVGQGMSIVFAGGALGLALALALTRVLRSMLYGVSATDPLTFGMIAVLLTAVALLACYVPARRATRIDPLAALRHE